MTNFSVNPLVFKSMSLATSQDQSKFLLDLSLLLSQMTNALNAAGNSAGTVNGGSLTITDKALGTVSTAQTVPCANACFVTVSLTMSASVTLTLSNLQVGIPVVIKVSATGSFTLKMAATTPSGTAYAISGITTAGTTVNFVSTGVGFSSTVSAVLTGGSVTESGGPTLYLGVVG
jgi:hypothetical protein